jgi:hypothetical protein
LGHSVFELFYEIVMLPNFFELEEVALEYLEKAFVYCEPFSGNNWYLFVKYFEKKIIFLRGKFFVLVIGQTS